MPPKRTTSNVTKRQARGPGDGAGPPANKAAASATKLSKAKKAGPRTSAKTSESKRKAEATSDEEDVEQGSESDYEDPCDTKGEKEARKRPSTSKKPRTTNASPAKPANRKTALKLAKSAQEISVISSDPAEVSEGGPSDNSLQVHSIASASMTWSSPPRNSTAGKKSRKAKGITKKEEPFTESALRKFFKKYEDGESPGTINQEGYQTLLEDMSLHMSDIDGLVVSYFFHSPILGQISLSDFTSTLLPLRTCSSASLASHLALFSGFLTSEQGADSDTFKGFYDYCFGVVRAEGQKGVVWEAASAVWGVLWNSLNGKGKDVGRDFARYCEEGRIGGRTVGKDVWEQLRQFVLATSLGPEPERSLVGYSEYDAWPSLMDEYAIWVRTGRPKRPEGK